MKFASLCILNYQRSEFFKQSFESLAISLDYPAEILVHDDGSDDISYLLEMFKERKFSWLVLNGGGNMGVGASLSHLASISHGDYIVKMDTDLTYESGWLSKSVAVMENNPDISSLSMFNYNHYDSMDNRFSIERERSDCYIVKDLVSSIYMFRKEDLPRVMPLQDDGNHQRLGVMAITKTDLVHNFGFGLDKSIYVESTPTGPQKRKTSEFPKLFN